MSQLKEINGKYYQQCKVVMLATESRSKLHLNRYNKLISTYCNHEYSDTIQQYLYILSDDEIKEGDWVLNTASSSNRPFQIDKIGVQYITENKTTTKKIIATTDESLFSCNQEYCCEIPSYCSRDVLLPKLSDSFIKKYIKEYNVGNLITNVLVEYENYHIGWSEDQSEKEYVLGLKVDSDNTITIKKLKNSYSKEEISELINQFYGDLINAEARGDILDIKTWKEENL